MGCRLESCASVVALIDLLDSIVGLVAMLCCDG